MQLYVKLLRKKWIWCTADVWTLLTWLQWSYMCDWVAMVNPPQYTPWHREALRSGPAPTHSWHPETLRMWKTHLGLPWKKGHQTQIWFVVWTPLKNISQLGWLFPIYGKIKHVPNHQPANHRFPAFSPQKWQCIGAKPCIGHHLPNTTQRVASTFTSSLTSMSQSYLPHRTISNDFWL